MIGASLIFFDPNWPRMMMSKVRSLWRREPQPPIAPSCENQDIQLPALSWTTRALLLGLGVFALLQILIPLRHLAYPSNVRWSEEGYLLSWRVMLTEKSGFVQYRVSDPDTQQAWIVEPGEYLTPLQTERMVFQPDLILQTAHIIADDFTERGYEDVTVKADAFVSWNGRPNSQLIDPDADLARIGTSLAPKSWILPYESAARDGR